jgi:hypothetical protein
MVAADQNMVIRCFGDDLAGLVDDDFHALPPVQRPLSAATMLCNFINFLPASGVPMQVSECSRAFGRAFRYREPYLIGKVGHHRPDPGKYR